MEMNEMVGWVTLFATAAAAAEAAAAAAFLLKVY